jgi:tetratricopeptide (TPR) repeat protein
MPDKSNAAELTPAEAIEFYERATKPGGEGGADEYLQLGAAYYIAHEWDRATAALERAIAMNPNLGHAHYYLGVLYAAKGDQARAQQELDAVLRTTKNPILIAQAKARIPAVSSPTQLAGS